MNFIERKISSRKAISILAKSGIEVEDHKSHIILDFLYLMAKNYTKNDKVENDRHPNEKSNLPKSIKRGEPIVFRLIHARV